MPRRCAAALALLAGFCGHAAAGLPRLCAAPQDLTPTAQDKLIRVAALAKDELDASGARIALVARSGLDLARIGQRYSHAGLALAASGHARWSVRQLYYACDEGRPRIFDQGMSGFALGMDDPATGYLSIVLLPRGAASDRLEAAALDDVRATRLLGAKYSANAYAFGLRYQNCNQWVAELMGASWGQVLPTDAELPDGGGDRGEAQRRLRALGYAPTRIELGLLRLAAGFVPFVHSDDHPADSLALGRHDVSLPESLERFVRAQLPGAERIELCHRDREVVIHRGWEPIADGCVAGAGDRVVRLD